MNTIQLTKQIINAKNKKKIIKLLNRYRVPISKSKYC